VAFKIDSRFLEHSLTRDNVIRDEHYAKAMAIVERVARTRLMTALFARLAAVAAGEAEEDDAGRVVMYRCAAAVCEAGEPDPQWLGYAAIPMIAGPPRSLAELRERRRGRKVYRAGAMSPVCARLISEGHLVVRAVPGDGVPALLKAVLGEPPIAVATLCTAVAIDEAEARTWGPLRDGARGAAEGGQVEGAGGGDGAPGLPESAVAGRVAISQAQFGELTPVAEVGQLASGWLANGRALVLAAEHPTLVQLRVGGGARAGAGGVPGPEGVLLARRARPPNGRGAGVAGRGGAMATDDVNRGAAGCEGELDSTGRFTLDRAKAREKLQKFQLVDAHRYVLELVQAAVLRGATRSRSTSTRTTCTCASTERCSRRRSSRRVGVDLRRRRRAAAARGAAAGARAERGAGAAPKRIVVRSGGQELRLVPGAEDVHRAVEPAIAGTTIHVVQRVKLKGIGLFFKNLVGQLAEEVHLVQRCVYAAPEITLDGVKISRGMQVDGALGVAEIATPGTRGLVAVTKEEGPGELRLIKDGVWIDARPLVNCGPGVLAIVEGDALRKDVSLAQIVADEALAAVWGLVGAARWSAMVRVLGLSRSPEGAGRGYEQRVRTEALRFLSLAEMPAGPDRTALLDGLTWSDARTYNPERAPDHGRVSLRELSAAMEAGSGDEPPVLRYSPRVYGVLAPEGRPIPFVVDGECEGLARVLGGVLVPDEGIARAAKRAEARKKFLTRKSTLTLPASQRYEVRGTFEGDGISGQLGVSEAGAEGSSRRWQEGTTWLYCEGCLLTVMQLDWGIPGLEVAVEARFEPTDDFADAVRDEVVVDVALHVLAALPGLLSPLVYSKRTSIEGGVRGIVKSWLMLVFDEAARTSLWSG
jgi:hypothetical protein